MPHTVDWGLLWCDVVISDMDVVLWRHGVLVQLLILSCHLYDARLRQMKTWHRYTYLILIAYIYEYEFLVCG
jgi:hypothetical protein